jgi:hypothetical protein
VSIVCWAILPRHRASTPFISTTADLGHDLVNGRQPYSLWMPARTGRIDKTRAQKPPNSSDVDASSNAEPCGGLHDVAIGFNLPGVLEWLQELKA